MRWSSGDVMVSGASAQVRVVNRQDFVGLDHFRLHWRVLEDGVPIREGDLAAPEVVPGDTALLTVPVGEADSVPGAEYLLDIGFITREAGPMLPAGHEPACGQVSLPCGPAV